MRRFRVLMATMLAAVLPLAAQEQSSEVLSVGTDKFLRWYGIEGRTYFLQVSDPNDHLGKWTWAPIIETGNGEDISYEVDGTATKGFFRLWFTDDLTTDPDGGDFDGDGLSNIAEVTTHQTNPLRLDTDGDGMPDRWEFVHVLNPLIDDAGGHFQGGPTTNLEAFQAGVLADPNATIEDYDGDTILNGLDSTPLEKDELVVVVDTEILNVFWDQGGEHRTTSDRSESFSIDRVFLRYPDDGIYVPMASAFNSLGLNGTLEKASIRIEATQPSESVRKVKFLDVLDTSYPSLLSANPSIATRRVIEFTIHTGSISSETIQVDPGVQDLTQSTPVLASASYLARVEIVPDDGQPGNTGDQIPSNNGAAGEKHYVSPKKTTEIPDEFVVLKAKGIEQALFDKVIEWECVPAANGSVDPNDSIKFRVKRDAAAKTVVKLKAKQGGQIADVMNVWVVWSEVDSTIADDYQFLSGGNPTDRWSYSSSSLRANYWRFQFTIQPASIITDADRPKLDGANDTKPPGHGSTHHHLTQFPADHASHKWDASRQIEVTVVNPQLIPKAKFPEVPEYSNQPKALDVAIPFPNNPVQGNDDPGGGGHLDEDSNPYAPFQDPTRPDLVHQLGQISCSDRPEITFLNSMGVQGSTLAVVANFKEFARLNLTSKGTDGKGWYRISDYTLWHYVMAATYGEHPAGSGIFRWVNSGSVSATGKFDIPE